MKGLPSVSARHSLTKNSGRKGKASEIGNVDTFNIRAFRGGIGVRVCKTTPLRTECSVHEIRNGPQGPLILFVLYQYAKIILFFSILWNLCYIVFIFLFFMIFVICCYRNFNLLYYCVPEKKT